MAQSNEDEIKIFAQIRAMEEGDLKTRLLETFMQNSSSSSNIRAPKKPIFVDASYEKIQKAIYGNKNRAKFAHSLWGR